MLLPRLLLACLCAGSPTPLATPVAAAPQEAGPGRQEPGAAAPTFDEEAVERGGRALRDVLAAAGSCAPLPGDWRDYVLWYDTAGVRYDSLEIYRTRILRPGERWRTNHLEPRFFFANGSGRGYLLRELVAQANEQGDYRAQFRREVGAGDTYWCEVDGLSLRSEDAVFNAQRTMLGEYFYGLMPHSLTLFEPQMAWVRNERVGGRTLEVYSLRVLAPFEAEFGHASSQFTVYVDPSNHRITQLQFPDPNEAGVTIVIAYTDWVRVRAPQEQVGAWRERLRAQLAERREEIGEEGYAKLLEALEDPEGRLVPSSLLLPSRRVVFEDRGGKEREFLCADFHLEALPEAALARPWQTGRVWPSPYRSDFFDPEPEDGAGAGAGGDGGR